MPQSSNDFLFYLAIAVISVFVIGILLFELVSFFSKFSQELKFIKSELKRTDGAEHRYWKKQKRKLWLSLIPFVNYKE